MTRKPSCLISCNHIAPEGGLGAFVGQIISLARRPWRFLRECSMAKLAERMSFTKDVQGRYLCNNVETKTPTGCTSHQKPPGEIAFPFYISSSEYNEP